MTDMKPRSHEVTDGMERAPARAMLRAIGMTDDDWGKAQVGVASSWNEVTPCNMPLDRLAKRAKVGVRDAGGFPIEFVTIAVSDGISMGHEGMRGSLVSREIITDSVECVMHAERFDALGDVRRVRQEPARHADGRGPPQPVRRCSSTAARSCPVATRIKRSTSCRCSKPSARARPARSPRTSSARSRRKACPTEGSCAGMFTANTMASIAEAIGMALPGSASPPAVDRRRDDFAYESGRAVMHLLEMDLRPRQIMTKEAFENAIAVTMALGGSTNAVLHLLAIANEAHVELELDDFNRDRRRGCRTSPT